MIIIRIVATGCYHHPFVCPVNALWSRSLAIPYNNHCQHIDILGIEGGKCGYFYSLSVASSLSHISHRSVGVMSLV